VAESYALLADLKRMRRITDTTDDALLTKVLSVASRRIDARTNRRFWLDPAPVQRVFGVAGRATPDGRLLIDDIGSVDGLVVETGGSSAWSAVTGYELGPDNALVQGWPYTELVGSWSGTRVRITARWGWPGVPEDISMATLLLASRLYMRKDSPEGLTASAEFGSVRVSRWDPDVDALVAPYVQPKPA
jgi:hypothetical protein